MARFNESVVAVPVRNLAGGRAYAEGAELELLSLALSSFVKDQFYRGADEQIAKALELVGQVRPEFAAKVALYARDTLGMRSITHVIAAGLAPVRAEWKRRFYSKIVVRLDDMTEILSLLGADKRGYKIPNAVKRGFADAFARFGDYQIAKYKMAGKGVTLVDVVNMVHPKPVEKNAAGLKGLIAGTLRSFDTWESDVSAAGQEEDATTATAQAWASLVRERKIGQFALLRNLRNIATKAPDVLDEALALLVEPERIATSRIMPFRYYTALVSCQMEAWAGARRIIAALGTCVDMAMANVPKLAGKALVVVDRSGSMGAGPNSPLAKAALFAAAVLRTNQDAELLMFSDRALRYAPVSDRVLPIMAEIMSKQLTGGTNFNVIFEGNNKPYDRIIILSDMQGWMAPKDGYFNLSGAPTKAFADYRKRTGADPFIYSWDLAGYGTLMFPERRVFALAGFSDKMFDIMGLLETDREALIHRIEAIEL